MSVKNDIALTIRLNKYISQFGAISRRAADVMIEKGRVTVNGEVATVGVKVLAGQDVVLVDGVSVDLRSEKNVYFALNKPRGYVCTTTPHFKEKIVTMLIAYPGKLYPVGRLDADSEGLLFITNDGDFAYQMTHPKFHIPKKYHVLVRGRVTDASLELLRCGVPLDDGDTAPCLVHPIDSTAGEILLEFVLHEGRKRQIRRMCAAVNFFVVRLTRVAIGDVTLGSLAVGSSRKLHQDEVDSLLNYSGTTA